MSLYKYRSIGDQAHESPADDIDIQNLINNQAIFSLASAFNDPLDCEFEVTGSSQDVTPDELREAIKKCWEGYHYFCLSKEGNLGAMWSHYASRHTGFCIEFQGLIGAKPVDYKPEFPSLEGDRILEAVNDRSKQNKSFQKMTAAPLFRKLSNWRYEAEYRYIASDTMGGIMTEIPGVPNKKIAPYPAEWVRSVIFGINTPDSVKHYIMANMPNMVFRQATKTSKGLSIRPMSETGV